MRQAGECVCVMKALLPALTRWGGHSGIRVKAGLAGRMVGVRCQLVVNDSTLQVEKTSWEKINYTRLHVGSTSKKAKSPVSALIVGLSQLSNLLQFNRSLIKLSVGFGSIDGHHLSPATMIVEGGRSSSWLVKYAIDEYERLVMTGPSRERETTINQTTSCPLLTITVVVVVVVVILSRTKFHTFDKRNPRTHKQLPVNCFWAVDFKSFWSVAVKSATDSKSGLHTGHQERHFSSWKRRNQKHHTPWTKPVVVKLFGLITKLSKLIKTLSLFFVGNCLF